MTGLASVPVSITGKRGWIHKARRSDNYEGDEMDKQKLINILRDYFGIASIRPEPYIALTGRPRYPDVKTTDHDPGYYFELDGEYHGSGDSISTTDATYRRNKDYKDLGYNLIVINKEATNGYETVLIIELLEAWGLKKL